MMNYIIKVNLSITLIIVLVSILSIYITHTNLPYIGTQLALAQRINLVQGNEGSSMISGIKGTVYFNGMDCPPTAAKTVPPCSGPYPEYNLTIFGQDGKTIITTVKTDRMGNYSVSLAPGHYIIYVQRGPLMSQMEPDNVIIKENEIMKKDLYIETGIR
jgi:hypothetical protein